MSLFERKNPDAELRAIGAIERIDNAACKGAVAHDEIGFLVKNFEGFRGPSTRNACRVLTKKLHETKGIYLSHVSGSPYVSHELIIVRSPTEEQLKLLTEFFRVLVTENAEHHKRAREQSGGIV